MCAVKYKDLKKRAEQSENTRNKKQKVAFVLQSLTAGGAERVLITLMNGLDRERFTPEFIVMNNTGPLGSWIAKDIPIHSLETTRISRGIGKLAGKLNEIEPDIIVSTMAAMNYGVLLAKPLLKKKAKIVIREAVTPSSIAEAQRFPWLVKSAYKNLYPQADMILSPARCIINEFRSYLGMNISQHILLHNPVDVQKIKSTEYLFPEATEARKRTRHFVCAGRLHKQKGFDRLIESLASRKGQNWTLDILGEGKEREALESLIKKHGLQDQVTLKGLVKEPWPLIAQADAFLLPSRWEGLPNVTLESLCAGTPVIAHTEAGGIQEIADMAGKNNVQVVRTMDDMLDAMDLVLPQPTRSFRPSLLPEYFHLDKVTERFSDLLDGKDTGQELVRRRREIIYTPQRRSFGRRAA